MENIIIVVSANSQKTVHTETLREMIGRVVSFVIGISVNQPATPTFNRSLLFCTRNLLARLITGTTLCN